MIAQGPNFVDELMAAHLYTHADAIMRVVGALSRNPSRENMQAMVAAWTKAQLELWDVTREAA